MATWIAIAVLGVVAIGLTVFALRPDPVPNAGDRPMVTLAPTPSSTRQSPPTTAAAAPPTDGRQSTFLDGSGDSGVRASAGSCDGQSPSVEVTEDGGTTWSPAAIPVDMDVREILGVRAVGDDQIDVVVEVGPQCVLNVLTSFTSGEFWELNPERLSEQTYVDPDNPTSVTVTGGQVPAPCPAVDQVAATSSGALARCDEGVFAYSTDTAAWRVVTAGDIASVAVGTGSDASATLIAIVGATDCEGVQLQSVPFAADGAAGTPLGCATFVIPPSKIAVVEVPGAIWMWADGESRVSLDRGQSWV